MQRWITVSVLSLGSLFLLLIIDPIPQDPDYHRFIDTRTLLNVPNFLNIFSNVPFLLVGWFGFSRVRQRINDCSRSAWLVFFVGVFLVGLGSAYYHINPTSPTLVWDRLPMTIGFMGLFVAILSEWISPKLIYLLVPMCLLGVASVAYWHWADDLRFYAWVQFFPLLLIMILRFTVKPVQPYQHWLFIGLVLYIFSKLCEHFDRQIYTVSEHVISGHTAKHFAAAFAVYCIAIMLSLRSRQA